MNFGVKGLFSLLLLTSGLLLLTHSESAQADLLEKNDIPKPLHAFYQDYVLEFHSHSSTPEVYKAKCFEGRYPDCIIMWAEILPSNSDVHISIVAPNAVESRITLPMGDNEFILGVEPVDGSLLLSLINTQFVDNNSDTSVSLYQIQGEKMTLISETFIGKEPKETR